jgi:hypothetical protein
VKSLPVFALPEVEADIRAAMAHYASWRSDGVEYLRQRYSHSGYELTPPDIADPSNSTFKALDTASANASSTFPA